MDPIVAIRKLFGRRVRHFRELRGWQLDDVGSRLGKSRARMSRIENGKQNLTMVDIAAIGQALEVPVDELFRHDGAFVPSIPPVVAERCVKKGREAVQAINGFVKEMKSLVA